jgi:hypothetical protein
MCAKRQIKQSLHYFCRLQSSAALLKIEILSQFNILAITSHYAPPHVHTRTPLVTLPFSILLLEPLRVYYIYIGAKTPHRIRIAAALLLPELPWHIGFKQTIEHVCVSSLLYIQGLEETLNSSGCKIPVQTLGEFFSASRACKRVVKLGTI